MTTEQLENRQICTNKQIKYICTLYYIFYFYVYLYVYLYKYILFVQIKSSKILLMWSAKAMNGIE